MVTNTNEQQAAAPIRAHIVLLGHLLLALAVGGIIGALIGLLIPRNYTATAVLQFPMATSAPASATGGGGSADKPALSLLQGMLSVPQPGTSPSTAVLILTSHKVVNDLVKEFTIQPEWSLGDETPESYFRKKFICVAGGSNELHITYTANKPDTAEKVVKESINVLTRTVEELSLDPAGSTVKFLAKNLHDSEDECARAEDALIQFLRKQGGVAPDMQLQSLSQLDTDLQREFADRRSGPGRFTLEAAGGDAHVWQNARRGANPRRRRRAAGLAVWRRS